MQFDSSGGGWKGGQDSHAATMGIWAPGWFEEDNRMSLTPGTYQLEIERTDTDQSIVFEMETPLESTIEATQILNDLFDSTGDIYDSPTIDIIGDSGSEEFSVSQTDGDENIFSAGDVFGTYLIRLNRDGEVLGATQERVHGIGYPGGYQETHQDGTASVTFPAISEIDESWNISFEIRNEAPTDGGQSPYDITRLHESEFSIDGDQLVTSFELDDLEPVPEEGYQLCWIRFSNGEDDGTNLSCRGYYVEDGADRSSAISSGGDGGQAASSAVFQRYSDAADSTAVQALLAGGGLTGAYIASKKFVSRRKSKRDSEETNVVSEDGPSDTDSFQKNQNSREISIPSYEQLEIGETIEQTEYYRIDDTELNGQDVWILSYSPDGAETISTETLDEVSNEMESWNKIDPHPSLLEVYGYEASPYPWAAVQSGSYPAVVESLKDLSVKQKITILSQACEAIHHLSRYGIMYTNLTSDSLLLVDKTDVLLKGLVDQFNEENQRYAAPEEIDGEYTERSLVYRLGLIAYELFTGECPQDTTTTVESSSISLMGYNLSDENTKKLVSILNKSLSNVPEDRYETVLHFRDELRDIDIT